MNQRNNYVKSKKSINPVYKNKSGDIFNNDEAKSVIMDKYGVSLEEAEMILIKIEKMHNNNNNNKNSNDKQIENSHYKNANDSNVRYSGDTKRQIVNHGQPMFKKNLSENVKKIHKSESNLNIQKIGGSHDVSDKGNKSVGSVVPQDDVPLENDVESVGSVVPQDDVSLDGDIDSLIQDIVPDYNQQISIKVDHIDLTFEVSNEKVETLKERFIRILKSETPEKIKIHALKDISFKVYKGEKIGIIGYNGAGKSTLLNVITGIYVPDKGAVTTYGNISPLLSLGAGFDPNYSGRKNIILNGAVLGYEKEFLESKINEIIEFSELGKFIDIPIKNYSSGMLAKLGFSIATAVEPDILIIDEILGVGDVNFQRKCSDKIRSLMDGGTTVILVSHSIPQIRNLCDKAIWIDKGSVRAIGEVNKVCDEYLKDAENASTKQLENIQFK